MFLLISHFSFLGSKHTYCICIQWRIIIFFYHTLAVLIDLFVFLHLNVLLCLTSEQQPLRLNPAEVQDVIAAVCSEAYSPNTNVTTASTRLSNNSGKPSTDVAVSVLIKLIIDMYVSINCCLLCFIPFLVIICLAPNKFSHGFTIYS